MESKQKIIIGAVFVLLVIIAGYSYYPDSDIISIEEGDNYLGPVQEGYDEDYFRQTGITKRLTLLSPNN